MKRCFSAVCTILQRFILLSQKAMQGQLISRKVTTKYVSLNRLCYNEVRVSSGLTFFYLYVCVDIIHSKNKAQLTKGVDSFLNTTESRRRRGKPRRESEAVAESEDDLPDGVGAGNH